ncbi:acetyl-CoA carboxylase biotin carboxylase subunit [Lacticaseibacillus sp. GG6-2]
MFKTILVANRGEIAVRLIQTIHEMGIKAVAVYSSADADSLHVQLADQAVCIGPAPATASYLNMQNILAAAVLTGAEAIHPGFGFLSENPDFAEACAQAGLVFIGPRPDTLRQLGDKATARALMTALQVPVIPGSDAVATLAQAQQAATKLHYPVMLKAAAGGGGKGIRLLVDEAALTACFDQAQTEAVAAFGSGEMYLEKVLVQAKHIEVQVLADEHGGAWTFPERDCSLQYRKQKLIEMSPALALTPALRQKLQQYATRIVDGTHYVNAGTIEFLVADGQVYFLEMNTRIQVEHPVTEAVSGIDLLQWQIKVAAKVRLDRPSQTLSADGVAIECRVNAQDPDHDFAPSTGTITQIAWPLGGDGIRIDTSIRAGSQITPYYDAMLAKLIVHAKTASAAWLKLQRAMQELQIQGVTTNLAWQRKLVASAMVQSGKASITYVEQRLKEEDEEC